MNLRCCKRVPAANPPVFQLLTAARSSRQRYPRSVVSPAAHDDADRVGALNRSNQTEQAPADGLISAVHQDSLVAARRHGSRALQPNRDGIMRIR
jgi:hypothetical protein